MRPDIIWIATTQWRSGALGMHGDTNARTPVLDAWAQSGTDFFEATTPHPFGPFARAAMLTGKLSPENGVRDYFDPLPPHSVTIARTLTARGYYTAFLGKWHLAQRDPAAPLVGETHARTLVPPEARGGFEFWEGFEGGFQLNDPWLHGSEIPQPQKFSGYQSDVLCERAAAWWKRDDRSPLKTPRFLYLSLESPHPPYLAPAGGVEPAPAASLSLATNVPAEAAIAARARRELSGYYAHIAATDRALAKVFSVVDHSRTVVLFTSVHGDMHGAHGLFRKGWPHEESVRVPFILRTPGGMGRRDDSAISLVDLCRLTARWADGNFAPFSATVAPISMPSVVRLPDQCDRVWSGWRSPRRKLVLNEDGTPWLYFDLENDPGETRNLAVDPRRAAEIAAWRQTLSRSPR